VPTKPHALSGSRIRITGQLIDASNGKHIWAERYDRLLEDVFAVRDEITELAKCALAIDPGEPRAMMSYGFRLSTMGHHDRYRPISSNATRLPPATVGRLRANLGAYAHCELFIEGLRKAGVPD
jgi:hypothetical protein